MHQLDSTILVTGGAGYIGSHICVELLISGFKVVVVDNLSNSSIESIERVKKITKSSVVFYQFDINSEAELDDVFIKHKIDAVIHLAGLKSVSESVSKAIQYYQNNISGTISLCNTMNKFGCKDLIFSSSATVYAPSSNLPLKEDFPLLPTSPYGRSKLVVESFLSDLHFSDEKWSIGVLRYFNPVGAHKSGLIGEDPRDIPNNLMPYILQVAIGKLEKLYIYGSDYDTHDGTGVRDYIHVVDLAKGHVSALNYLLKNKKMIIVNLGTGKGYSVLDMVRSFEKATNKKISYEFVERRSGDIDSSYADSNLAKLFFEWSVEYNLDDMCRDAWNWQVNNPHGYNNKITK